MTEQLHELRIDSNPFSLATSSQSDDSIRLHSLSFLPQVVILNTVEVTPTERSLNRPPSRPFSSPLSTSETAHHLLNLERMISQN
jgi:hypothetical protein